MIIKQEGVIGRWLGPGYCTNQLVKGPFENKQTLRRGSRESAPVRVRTGSLDAPYPLTMGWRVFSAVCPIPGTWRIHLIINS